MGWSSNARGDGWYKTAGAAPADAAQTTAFLARVAANGTTLDATHIAAYKAFINGLVSTSSTLGGALFSRFDGLGIGATQDLPTSLLNLISTSWTLTFGSGNVFTPDRGPTFGNQYSTGFTPSSAGGAYALNSAHMMVWSNTLGDTVGGEFGVSSGSNAFFSTNSAATGSVSQLNQGSNFVEHTSGGKGFYLASRTASNNVDNYWGLSGTLTTLSSSAIASTSLPNDVMAVGGAQDFAGSNKQISAFSWGAALSPTDVANFYSLLQAFMTAVGN